MSKIFDISKRAIYLERLYMNCKILFILCAFLLSFSFQALASTDYSCFGTEPFWGLKLEGSKVSLSFPLGDEVKTEQVISRVTAYGVNEDVAFVVKINNGSATIIGGECNDGMSDEIYPSHIVFASEDSVYYGCCKKSVKN